MNTWLKKLLKDESGAVVSAELLIIGIGIIVIGGAIYAALLGPLQNLHKQASEGIRNVTRGY